MKLALRPGHARLAFFLLAGILLALVAGLALALNKNLLVPGALAFGLILLAAMHQLLAQAQARATSSALSAEAASIELRKIQAGEESRSADLALLGRYGNLLIACTDLAEALQISQQMLSQLLPDSAGTIYPLIDGEGLAEATHLWGSHVGETKLQEP